MTATTTSTTTTAMNGSSSSNGVKSGASTTTVSFWESGGMADQFDPTRIFSVLVITIMLIKYLMHSEWKDFAGLVTGFFANIYVVASFTAAVAVAMAGLSHRRQKSSSSAAKSLQDMWKSLSAADRWAAEWYWWNAWLYHSTMDGCSGSFGLVPVVVQQYKVLDTRFTTGHVVPWCIGCVELFIMQPVCWLTVYAILTNHPSRYTLEMATSILHIFGMIVFVASEVYEGQTNVPALHPVGNGMHDRWGNVSESLTLYHFTYYWFGFWFCNLVWGWVPGYRIYRAYAESHKLALDAAKLREMEAQKALSRKKDD